MGKTVTFGGRIRSIFGASGRNPVTPATTVHTVIFSFDPRISAVPVKVGYSATSGPDFWLPKGAIIQTLGILNTPTGTTPTLDIGIAGNTDYIWNEFAIASSVPGLQGSVVSSVSEHGADRLTGGLPNDSQVVAGAGVTAATSSPQTMVMTYTVFDDGKKDSSV